MRGEERLRGEVALVLERGEAGRIYNMIIYIYIYIYIYMKEFEARWPSYSRGGRRG